MKKEYILSDEEKQQKKQKIEENRIRKRQFNSSGSRASPENGSPTRVDSAQVDSPRNGSVSPGSSGLRPQARVLPSSRTRSEDLDDANLGTQGGNLRHFLPLRFYVKSNLANM